MSALWSCISVIGVATIFGLTYGLTAPLVAADLQRLGKTELFIGLNAAMYAVGVLGIAPLLPRLTSRYGPRRILIFALLGSAALLALFPLVPYLWLWFPLRLALGMTAESLFVLAETWTNDLTNDRIRGRMMAFYTASVSIGYAGGPLILSMIGIHATAYIVGAAIALIAVVPAANPLILPPQPMKPTTTNTLEYFRKAPMAIAATFLNAVVETAGLSFVALYASGMGWGEQESMWLISTLMIGAVVLQLPIGLMADRMHPERLTLGLAVLAAIGAFFWPWMLGHRWLAYSLIFLWGGVFVGIYTVMLSIIGGRFSGTELVGVYAAMSVGWGGGALLGPSMVGFAMSASATYGLPYSIAIGCALFAVFMFMKRA